MSRQEKLLNRLASNPKDFTWPELRTLMNTLGVELTSASGSARKFMNQPPADVSISTKPSIEYSEGVPGSRCHRFSQEGGLSQMNTTVSYRGYDGSIIHDAEDHLYHGRILGICDTVIYHGATVEEAETTFHEAVDEYMNDFEKAGKEPPKPFASLPVHMPHELQVRAALFAQINHLEVESVLNMTLSQFFEQAA